MFNKNFNLISTVGFATILSVSVASADGHSNAKELNGRSSYIGVAYIKSDLGDISFNKGDQDNGGNLTVSSSKKAAFDDPEGAMVTFGNDYGYVRIENEYSYRETDVKTLTGRDALAYTNVSGSTHIGTAMVNAAFEYSFDPNVVAGEASSGISLTPYLKAGAGAVGVHGNLNFDNAGANDSANDGFDDGMFIAPAMQAGLGLTVGLPYGLEVFGEYSELLAYTYDYKDSNDIHMKTVSGGLRLNF